jgi:serine/threonine protein kinase
MILPETPTPEFPYQIEGQIGEGAMGTVYRAHEPSLGRKVAIKVLRQDMLGSMRPDVAQEAMQRFTQEARAAAALSHPGITTIYRVGTIADAPYIVMEWLEGRTLEDIIDEAAPLEVNEVLLWTLTLLEALQQAHQVGIIHRDIKPANLMVLTTGRLKVTDFGVAHVEQSDLVSTKANMILGTPLYASPEQIRGEPVDARSDIYSIGVVIYEALTGRLPFEANGIFQLAELMRTSAPTRPSTFNSQIPDGVEKVLLRALARDANQRFPSATAMLEAIAPFVTFDTTGTGFPVISSTTTPNPAIKAPVQTGPPTVVTRGKNRMELVANMVQTWASQPFGMQNPGVLLARLLERPLHAAAFAGAVKFGERFFLLYDGLIYAAFNVVTGESGDIVYETIPEDVTASIFPVPEHQRKQLVLLLSSLVHEPRVRHANLDTSFVDLRKMADKLREERFSGAIKLRRGGELGYILLWQGENVCNVFSAGWHEDASRSNWRTWIADADAIADVEERRTVLPAIAYREELKNFAFQVEKVDRMTPETIGGQEKGEPIYQITPDSSDMPANRAARGTATMRNIYRSDPLFSFLCWMLTGLPSYFTERSLAKGWKYLAGWTSLVEKATLHYTLPRPASRDEDFFDLVTTDNEGKVLHVIDHYARVGPEELTAFVEKTRAAKEARIKTGDIGGAILIAREFLPETFELYKEFIAEPEKTSLLYNLQSTFTKYSGFVRIGPTRGFHLLLVRESSRGFEPLINKA